ncbi:MAG TPA: hypothetical protein VJN88_07305 [Ktedonobacterales bacterium]|nr:hypothetical protein [Ktedonobacterales bacterium]
MRIEGTYTFPATSERVFAALTQVESLCEALPGCERLIQLGPADADGGVTVEARVHGETATRTTAVTIQTRAARHPAHLQLVIHGYGPHGTFRGSGRIDLVGQENYTIVAYVWDLTLDAATSADQQRAAHLAGERYARGFCEQLSGRLLEHGSTDSAQHDEPVVIEAPTARGRIVALRQRAPAPALAFRASVWTQRALWMGTGFVLGIGAIGLTLNVMRRIGEQDEKLSRP